jgi:hypothetical protein
MPLTAPPEAVYPDVDTAFTVIQAHAKENGYAFYRHDKKHSRVLHACDRAGKYNPKGKNSDTHSSKQRQSTDSATATAEAVEGGLIEGIETQDVIEVDTGN